MAEPILYQDHPAMFRNRPIGFLLSCLLIPAFGLGLLILLVWWLQCRGTSLTVTDQRVSLRRGILSRYLNDVMIADIRNVQVGQSLSQRVFGVGFIGISSSGQGGHGDPGQWVAESTANQVDHRRASRRHAPRVTCSRRGRADPFLPPPWPTVGTARGGGGVISPATTHADMDMGVAARYDILPLRDGRKMSRPKKTSVLSWIGSTVKNLLEQASEEQVAPYVARLEAEITRLKRGFDFTTAATAFRLDPGDRPLVAKLLYKRFLQRVWRDAQMTATESELLDWLAGNLGLSKPATAELNQEAAVEVFGATLAKAFADGEINERERQHLEHVAAAAGGSVPFLMSQFFAAEGEQFIRGLFTDLAADGRLGRDEWKRFRQTAEWLGLPQERLLVAIRNAAKQLVEHTLTDARSDGEISENEERVIDSLLTTLIDDRKFRDYVRGEIAEAKEVQNLARGLLPSVSAPSGVAVRAGEVVHWAGPASFSRERVLASGTRVDATQGVLVITDSRAIMNSADRPAEVNHRKVLAHHAFGNCIEIRCSGKAAGTYEFPEGPRPVAIWEVAIGRANQTIVASDDKQSRRRIPREVRQRVWQKYGGRCAECSAETYLEFDHIIPVAKGGGNSDTNIQLLCRKCNLAKSDNI